MLALKMNFYKTISEPISINVWRSDSNVMNSIYFINEKTIMLATDAEAGVYKMFLAEVS